jgi:hypothetical protein
VYAVGLFYMDFNLKTMRTWAIKAIVHSVLVFWIPYGCYSVIDGSWDSSSGMTDGLAVAGLATFCSLVWGMQLTVSFQTFYWTRLNTIFIAISMIGWYIFILFYSNLNSVSPEFYGVTFTTLARPSYWLMIILVLGAMTLYDFSYELIRLQFFPTAIDVAREIDLGLGPKGPQYWGDEENDAQRIADVAKSASGPETPARLKHNPANGTSEVTSPLNASKSSSQNGKVDPPHVPGGVPLMRNTSAMDNSGGMYLPKEAVLGNADAEKRAQLGIVSPQQLKGFDYNHVSRRFLGSPQAPIDN